MSAADGFDKMLNFIVAIGLCGAAYFIFGGPREPVKPPNDAWFQSTVASNPGLVLVKFGAEWCGPCRMMEGELDKLSAQMGGRVSVVRVDVDQHPNLAQHYGVSSIPRLMLFKHGQVVDDRVGFMDTQNLAQWVTANAAKK